MSKVFAEYHDITIEVYVIGDNSDGYNYSERYKKISDNTYKDNNGITIELYESDIYIYNSDYKLPVILPYCENYTFSDDTITIYVSDNKKYYNLINAIAFGILGDPASFLDD